MRYHTLFIFIALYVIFTGCKENGRSEADINYSTLPEISFELITEIGDSENYLPARLNELFVAPDGSILISDWGSNTLEQFSSNGEHLKTIATQGDGPGELSNFFFIANAGSGTLLVEQQGSRRDFFEPNETGIYSYKNTVSADGNGSMGFHILGMRTDSEFFATPRNVVRNVQELIQNPVDYRKVSVSIVNDTNEILQDSLHILQSPNAHLTSMNGGFRVNTIPYRNIDRIKVMDDGNYLIARPENSTIKLFNKDHSLLNEIHLTVNTRSITGDDIDYVFRDTDREIRRDIEQRLHDTKPPFLNLWPSESHLWLHTDKSENGKEIVVLELDGKVLGKLMIHEFDEIEKVIGNQIYAIHKDPEMGHSIRIYDVDI